ncbi:MAG: hypothetical protein PWP23_1679 [Candidatus Sumerlaeota bacterium]|nr:hypothetical protein [Candidatus Sumerlaeota bacterium]
MAERPLGHIDADRFKATLSPEAYANLMAATAQSARDAGHFVVLGQQDELPPQETIAAFAKGLDLDPYSARQRLIAPTPRILRREENKEAADRWVAWMRALELRGFRLSERAFSQFHPIEVVSYKIDRSGVTFEIDNGRCETVPAEEVLCIVQGTVRSRDVQEIEKKDFLIGSAYGGHETVRVNRETRIDIHLAGVALIFRLSQSHLRFGDIFPGRQIASDVMMREVAGQIRGAYAALPLRDDFARASEILGQSWKIASKTTDFRYSAFNTTPFGAGIRNNRVTQESDEETFDLYSLLSRMQLIMM